MSWKIWHGRRVINEFSQIVGDAVQDAVEATGDYADNNEVPHDKGDLVRSKHIERKGAVTWIGYGGGGISGKPIVPYARRWHWEKANFQKGRKFRYLIDPMRKKYPNFLKRAVQKRGLKYVS